MLNDILSFELSISKLITQSPSLVSMYDTLVIIITLEKYFPQCHLVSIPHGYQDYQLVYHKISLEIVY